MTMPRDPRPAPPAAYIAAVLTADAVVLGGITVACGAPWPTVTAVAASAVPVLLVVILAATRLLEMRDRRRAVRARLDQLRATQPIDRSTDS